MSRLPQVTRDVFPDELVYVWDKLAGDVTAGEGGGVANIFQAMGNNPPVLRGYLRMGNALWAHCGLDLRTRELVILHCARLRKSRYEWHQHVRIGKGAGITEAEVRALADWRASGMFNDGEKAIFAYAEAMNTADEPPDGAFDALAMHFDPGRIVGITLLIAFYFATAKFLGAADVQTEEPFIGWG